MTPFASSAGVDARSVPAPARWRIRLGRLRQNLTGLALATWSWKALRFLPGTSQHFGPPRRRQTVEAYLARHPGRWLPVDFPPEASAKPPLHLLESQRERILAALAAPPVRNPGVMVLPHGRVLDVHGWPVGLDDNFLFELAYQGSRTNCAIYSGPRLSPSRRLPGRTLNLASGWADRNFGHFFLDVLPRATLVQRAGFVWDDFDRILVSASRAPARTREWLELAGIPTDRLIFLRRGDLFACDELVQPSHPGAETVYPRWVVDFHRAHSDRLVAAGPPARLPGRRLFISREGYPRSLTNHSTIAGVLAAHGFESWRPVSPKVDAWAFAHAEQIVGLHGAGLAPIVYSRPGAKVLELTADNHLYPFYQSLAAAGGLEYGMLAGPTRSGRAQKRSRPPDDAHFTIDPAEFAGMLRRMRLGHPSAHA